MFRGNVILRLQLPPLTADYVCPSIVVNDDVVYAIGGRRGVAIAVRAGGVAVMRFEHLRCQSSRLAGPTANPFGSVSLLHRLEVVGTLRVPSCAWSYVLFGHSDGTHRNGTRSVPTTPTTTA